MKIFSYALCIIAVFCAERSGAQTMELNLDQTIEMAGKSSLDMFRAKNMYQVKELNHQDFLMSRMPHLNLQLTPLDYNRSITEVYNSELMKYEPVEIQRLTSQYNLSINQEVGLTGGNVSINSSLMRSQRFGDNSSNNLDYISTPLSVMYRQNFARINEYKWKAKIEPLKFEQAKLELIEQREFIAVNTVNLFFSLLSAQMNLDIALVNLKNANTLLDIGKKRGQIGAISRDNLLNLELKQVNAEINVDQAKNQKESARVDLCEFLELPLNTDIRCTAPEHTDLLYVNPEQAKHQALKNNPDSHGLAQKLLEVEKQLLVAKRRIYDVNMEAGIGLNQNKEVLSEAFQDLLDRQNFRLSVNIPIFDWKDNKRRIQRAEINHELTVRENKKTAERLMIEVGKKVTEFNIKQGELNSAVKADSISKVAYEATQQLFSLGKASVIAINESYRSMYSARNQYLNALRNYWFYYYTIRQLCLYDFKEDRDLSMGFEKHLDISY